MNFSDLLRLYGVWCAKAFAYWTKPRTRIKVLGLLKNQKIKPKSNKLWPIRKERSVQFSSVQSLSRVRLFVTPWIAACQASLSITISWSSLKQEKRDRTCLIQYQTTLRGQIIWESTGKTIFYCFKQYKWNFCCVLYIFIFELLVYSRWLFFSWDIKSVRFFTLYRYKFSFHGKEVCFVPIFDGHQGDVAEVGMLPSQKSFYWSHCLKNDLSLLALLPLF